MISPIGRSSVPTANLTVAEQPGQTVSQVAVGDWRSGMSGPRSHSGASRANSLVPYLNCYNHHGDIGAVIASSLAWLQEQTPGTP